MKEYKIIAKTAIHLIKKEDAEITKISVGKKSHVSYIKNELLNEGIPKKNINSIQFKQKEEDILAFLKFKSGRRQKCLEIEAKGGNIYYNFYTSLGQFMCKKGSPSPYYWFAFALPLYWRKEIRKILLNNNKIKPIIQDIINKYTKNGQGLWFYFINENGKVRKETWKQVLI